jgi:hypothetical protein
MIDRFNRWADDHPWWYAAVIGLAIGLLVSVYTFIVEGEGVIASSVRAVMWGIVFFLIWGYFAARKRRKPRE